MADNTIIANTTFLRVAAKTFDYKLKGNPGDAIRIGNAKRKVSNVVITHCDFMHRLEKEYEEQYKNVTTAAVNVVNVKDIISIHHNYKNMDLAETQNNGMAKADKGASELEIKHNVLIKPDVVSITPYSDIGDNGFWIGEVKDKSFVIRFRTPLMKDFEFSWIAQCKPNSQISGLDDHALID